MVWNESEIQLFNKLNTFNAVQEYLDSLPYDAIGTFNRSPRYAIEEKRANCFEGGLLAAAVMEYYGYTPLIIDMIADKNDDHIIAVYKHKKFDRWGSIAKSNTSLLRGREPVFNTPRELVLSYFEFYMNRNREKNLRKYSAPINLNDFNKYDWRTTDGDLDETITKDLNKDNYKYFDILTPEMIDNLSHGSPQILEALYIGVNPDGLYKLK